MCGVVVEACGSDQLDLSFIPCARESFYHINVPNYAQIFTYTRHLVSHVEPTSLRLDNNVNKNCGRNV